MWALWMALVAIMVSLLEIGVETTSLDKPGFLEWMRNLRQSKGVGLFGLILAGHSDDSAGEVIDDPDYREDIARFSAEDCWFVYFVRESDAEERTPHQQHAESVHEVVKWLGLDIEEMPCLVFFERPEYDHYLYIPLDGLNKYGIVAEVRSIFEHVRREKFHTNFSTYRAVESYNRTRKRNAIGRSLFSFVYQASVDIAVKILSPNSNI